jgi:hypothetical protein
MTVKITFENVLNKDGEKRYKIAELTGCFKRDELPESYLLGPNFFYVREYDGGSRVLIVRSAELSPLSVRNHEFSVGFEHGITAEMRTWLVKTMKAAGHSLYEKNAEKRRLQAEWAGKKKTYTF